MQTALLRLLECKTDFESDEHIRRWLIRVTVNEARKVLRTPWRKRVLPLEEARDAPVFDAPEERELFSAVMALPRSYRMAVYLFYYENLSTEEIAAAMSAKTGHCAQLADARPAEAPPAADRRTRNSIRGGMKQWTAKYFRIPFRSFTLPKNGSRRFYPCLKQ